jgi:uridine kinase
MSKVIAIAGPPGSGKTALMTALAARLPDRAALFLDGFETPASRLSNAELGRWLKAGGCFDDFTIPGLVEALSALKVGRMAVEPVSGRQVAPARVVLFEMPFGRAYTPTAALIDFLVWLDTPLDIALARNVLAWERAPMPRPRAWLPRYMDEYLAVTRAVLIAQRTTVAAGADLVLDGLAPPAEAAQKLLEALQARALVQTGTET